MQETTNIVATTRADCGTRAARRTRRDGSVPAVFNTTKGVSRSICLDRHDFELILTRQGSENLLVQLAIDGGKAETALLKELQYDAVKGRLLHADFQAISMTDKIKADIPIKLIGESKGANEGGRVDTPIYELAVECLPGALVDAIEVNIEALGIGESLHVSDLTIPEGMEVQSSGDQVVVSIHAPIAEEVLEGEEALPASGGGAEPELIAKGKTDDEEGEGAGDAE